MNAVIKSGDLKENSPVRNLFVPPPAPHVSEAVRRLEYLEKELERSNTLVARLEIDLAAATKAGEAARLDGYQAGVVAGLERAEDQSAALRHRLDKAATEASQAFAEASTELSVLAGDVAGLALSRIVGDPSSHRELVAATVQRAIAELVGDAEIVIEISPEDFPGGVSEFADIVVGPKRRVEIAHGMPSGDCRIRLTLGMIDLSLPGQVERLRARLAAPCEPKS